MGSVGTTHTRRYRTSLYPHLIRKGGVHSSKANSIPTGLFHIWRGSPGQARQNGLGQFTLDSNTAFRLDTVANHI